MTTPTGSDVGTTAVGTSGTTRPPWFLILPGAVLLWTLVLGGIWYVEDARSNTWAETGARAQAQGALDKDLAYRRWAASKGGIYVPVTKETPPNPGLAGVANQTFLAPWGDSLTLVNPAYMTRQVIESSNAQYGTRGHITALKLRNEHNAPDRWEREVMLAMKAGAGPQTTIDRFAPGDTTLYYRLMIPLSTERPCLTCHEKDGFTLGDFRGGLSASVPYGPYQAAVAEHMARIEAWVLALWGLGSALLVIAWRLLRRAWAAQRQATTDAMARAEALVRADAERLAGEADRRRLEDQLQQALRLESVGRLAGGIAHDFNNMLSVIIGNAELVRDEAAPGSSQEEDAAAILQAARRSADLTQQLLRFARRQPRDPTVTDLNALVDGMASLLVRLAGEQVHIEIVRSTEPLPVLVDVPQMQQVLGNLVINARDAIAADGRIRIAVLASEVRAGDVSELAAGRYHTVSVADTGSGMPPEVIARAFEPFYTTKPQGKGTGLGLASAYGTVKAVGGAIAITSAEGEGTTVTIYLPPAPTA